MNIRTAFEWITRRAFTVFLFHEVSDHPSAFYSAGDLSVRPATFRRQIEGLQELFPIIDPEQLGKGEAPAPGSAMISFDDGSEGIHRHGLPILRDTKTPAVIFLNMGPVHGEILWPSLVSFLLFKTSFPDTLRPEIRQNPNRHLLIGEHDVSRWLASNDTVKLRQQLQEHQGEFLKPWQLRQLSQVSGIRFGNHLYQHYNASQLSEARLREEYVRNDALLSEYSCRVPLFSYPFGQPGSCYNEDTNRLVVGLGARRLFSSRGIVNSSPTATVLHRINMTEGIRSIDEIRAHVVRKQAASCFPRRARRAVALLRARWRTPLH
jgi:peptidoglycan/xylan/chitin deacetylase (PgdA/CDA1 family)